MSQLAFDCLDVVVEPYAAAPTLRFRLRITESTGAAIQAIALRCQIRIEPQRRTYSDKEAERLADLFGERSRWGDTLKPLQLANLSVMVPRFTGGVEVDMQVPVTYDLEVAGTMYAHGLEDGSIPLRLLFSGTVFGRNEAGLVVDQVPWDKEAEYRLPVAVWREMMDRYFPGTAWVRVRRDTLDTLQRVKSRLALPTWDAVFAELARAAEETVR